MASTLDLFLAMKIIRKYFTKISKNNYGKYELNFVLDYFDTNLAMDPKLLERMKNFENYADENLVNDILTMVYSGLKNKEIQQVFLNFADCLSLI